ncbi:hypothetical protein [Pseudaestuariivita atlantica]|uniref:Outer membrane protein beta-barrel domain-containing protein n=1 Tax=Pseudaestuariivita atlantica TaxID=1317121 RepID=A0A0L1JQX1_9RHOB|nr:hypothetical protein [Pseudaestuariivita atlantica]KNG94189.1 hypothetical protein ATO11_08170 [Pseudaestuariivita atlantica]
MTRALLLCLALCASELSAGAWPREKGTGFVSLTHRTGMDRSDPLTVPITQYTALFLEYGLTPRLTVGIDAGRSVSGDGKFVLFAGWPVRMTEGGHVLSVELGIGQIGAASVVRPGLSYGYGFARGESTGWFAADAVAEVTLEDGAADYKLDLTFGLGWPNGMKTYAQLQTGLPSGDEAFARVAGVVVLRPRRTGFATEIGIEYGVIGDDSVQMKVGLWREF